MGSNNFQLVAYQGVSGSGRQPSRERNPRAAHVAALCPNVANVGTSYPGTALNPSGNQRYPGPLLGTLSVFLLPNWIRPPAAAAAAAMARDLRLQALERLAALAATNSGASFDKSDLDRLCRTTPNRQGQVSATNGGHNAPLPRSEVGCVPMVAPPSSSRSPLLGLGIVG